MPLLLEYESTKDVAIADLVSLLRDEHKTVAFASVRMTVMLCGGAFCTT